MLIQSDEQKKYINNVKSRKRIIIFTRIIILISFFSLWEIAGRLNWIDSFLTSTPSKMFTSFIQVYNEGTLLTDISITCFETITGFLLGTILGALIAILLWWSDFVSKVLDPYIIVLNALPKVALAPIIIFWVGNGITAIIVIADRKSVV